MRRPDNARAMRAAKGRQPANPEIEFVVSCLATFVVVGAALAITMSALFIASMGH